MYPHSHVCRHVVHFYHDDGSLRSSVSAHVAAALRAGESALVIAKRELREQLTLEVHRQHVQGTPFGPDRGALVTLDAEATLDQFCVDGKPDACLFKQVVGTLLDNVLADGRPVAAYGEMVGVLCERGHYGEAVRLEAMWNELLAGSRTSLLCGYLKCLFDRPSARPFYEEIRAAHSDVMDEEPAATAG
jgi:hypothetical protein